MRRTVRYFVYAGSLCKKRFTLLREIFYSSFKFCALPNNAGPLLVSLVFNSFSSAGVILPFFSFVFVFSVVTESDSLSGVSYDSESSPSAAPSSRLVFCAARSLSLSATVLLLLFELELVDGGFSAERRRAVDVEGEFVEPQLLCFC